jgi:tRNA threonylcarbamoyladenosine biosynthesis protein TsaB
VRVLALDAATEACSVALLCQGELIVRSVESGKGHAQQILRMVEQVLAEAEVTLSMLDGLAASIGPGAFTGVRISVAVAQGLAFGAGLKVVPITTLEALSMQVLDGDAVRAIACLDARMGEVYWGCFAADAALGLIEVSPSRVDPPDRVVSALAHPSSGPYSKRYCGVGRGFAAYPVLAEIPGVRIDELRCQALPSAGDMARLGVLRLGEGRAGDPADLQPLYLRDKVALTEAERAAR